MEFGQRALGNRSIIADPRNPKIQDKLNLAVKFRRSLGLLLLYNEEHVHEYFIIPKGEKVPFMESVYTIK